MKIMYYQSYNLLFVGPLDMARLVIKSFTGMTFNLNQIKYEKGAEWEPIPPRSIRESPDLFGLEKGVVNGIPFLAGPAFSANDAGDSRVVCPLGFTARDLRQLTDSLFIEWLDNLWEIINDKTPSVSVFGAPSDMWLVEFTEWIQENIELDFFESMSFPIMICKGINSLNEVSTNSRLSQLFWHRHEGDLFGASAWPTRQITNGQQGAYAHVGAISGRPDIWSGIDSPQKFKKYM